MIGVVCYSRTNADFILERPTDVNECIVVLENYLLHVPWKRKKILMMGLLWFGPEYRQTLIQTFFERNVNSHHYIDEIIIPYVVPHQEFIGDNFLLMQ